MKRRRWLLIPAILAGVLVGGCSSGFVPLEKGEPARTPPVPRPAQAAPSGGPTNGLVQTSSGGGVTIDVEWQGLRDGLLTFGVTMDTHSVDLNPYDLGKLATLRDGDGREYRPSKWNAPPGDHHRKGLLTFATPDSLTRGTAGYVELILRDTAGVKERVLKWKLG